MNEEARPSIAETLISARLLILQSKRLILATLERRLDAQQVRSLLVRVERMRQETHDAHKSYSAVMLARGSPAIADYWPVAYATLVDIADGLSGKLRQTAAHMPVAHRYELATDVEMLESLVEDWRRQIRESMASVA